MSPSLAPDERERLEQLFERALELRPAERQAFVGRECADGGALQAELTRLLAAATGDDILTRIQAADPSERSGTRIGPYELLRRIGQGGMGDVYAARQLEPVERTVALKLIRAGMDSAQVVARFEAERQALARMSHVHVAQVYGGGATDDGRPYFVMEYVAGEPLTAHCDARGLSTRERLALFLDVCDGVNHAHQKGLIHRDLKPSNLLVAQQDGRAVVKVIDFGVARATTGRLADHSMHTMLGQVVGTLDYMSPEQADPGGVDVDTRSDVYSLGVVLYELLSGLLPFDHQTGVDRPLSEIQRTIREQEPPTPSTRLKQSTASAAAIARRRGEDERSLVHQLRGDLDWVCVRALEKDPDRRYPSVAELAEDVRRHLAHEPVLARRPGAAYRARKFVRRHRVAVGAGVVVVAGLLAGVGGIVSGRIEAEARSEELLRLSDSRRLEQLITEADALWPAVPAQIAAMQDWLGRARALLGNLDVHRETLATLQRELPLLARGGTPRSPDERGPTAEERWQHDLLVDLVAALEAFETNLLSEEAASLAHGVSVPQRLALARELAAAFAENGEYARRWAEALPDIRAAYPGLELTPQRDLLPLGVDRRSGLWEFAQLLSGTPARRVDGALERDADSGLVLVLLPGGEFLMGSQGTRPTEANYVDFREAVLSDMEAIEALHPVQLEPFFLSKYELTQAQWQRLTGTNPSSPDGGRESLQPVNQVDLVECDLVCRRLGLSLPSEEQWEYAARGGTTTPWWTGDTWAELEGAANLGDPQPWQQGLNSRYLLPDGTVGLASVGSYPGNPFGLHDVLGNVSEWTSSPRNPRSPDAASFPDPLAHYMARGGNYQTAKPQGARSASRGLSGPPETHFPLLGLRPARSVER